MNSTMQIIRNTGLFTGISDQEATAMSKCLGAETRRCMPGEILWREGDRVEQIGIVISGRIDVIKRDWWGNEIALSSNGPGSVICLEYACSGDRGIDVSIVSSGHAEVVLFWIAKVVRVCKSSCEFHSRLINNLVRMLSKGCMDMNRRLDELSKKTIRDKLRAYLSDCAKDAGSNEFTVPLNRQEMADHLNVDRSALSAELGRMRNDGILDFNKNQFVLLIGGDRSTRT